MNSNKGRKHWRKVSLVFKSLSLMQHQYTTSITNHLDLEHSISTYHQKTSKPSHLSSINPAPLQQNHHKEAFIEFDRVNKFVKHCT
jgi:hypothetical protein